MATRKIIMTKGLPASGKSTWAKEMVAKHPGQYKRINKDDLRAMLDVSHHSKGNEKFVLRARDLLLVEALKSGYHPIIDDTNLHPKHEARLRELAGQFAQAHGVEVQVEIKFFAVSVEEAIRRDLLRPVSVGERSIRQMYDKYLAPPPMVASQDDTLPKCILVDIDGTVADKMDRSAYDWARVGEDAPKWPIIRLVKSMKAAGYRIVFFSGRDEVCRAQSSAWLQQYFGWAEANFELHMRPANDLRKDSVVKMELFFRHVHQRYYVELVVDDRQQVVDMWRKELGLTCVQVDYGNF
jgi:predicted kinase